METALPNLDGGTKRIADWRGKVVLVNFWATWCPPCREEIPLFMETQTRYGKAGLQIVGIAIDNRDDVAAYRDGLMMNYPVLIAADDGIALMERFGNRLGSLPYSLVLGPDGEVLSRKHGAYSKTELDQAIQAALAKLPK